MYEQRSDLLFYVGVVCLGSVALSWVWYTNKSLSTTPPDPLAAEIVAPLSGEDPVVTLFSDIPTMDPLYPQVAELVRLGIIQGYQDQTFQPERLTNRSEALKALLKASPTESRQIHEIFRTYVARETDLLYVVFPDVQEEDWFAPYVYKAYTIGVIEGNPTGNFEAYRPITLAEFLKMLLVMERENIIPTPGLPAPFPAVPTDAWYTAYFHRAKEMGLLPLDASMEVHPSKELTRGMMTRLLYRYRELRHQRL